MWKLVLENANAGAQLRFENKGFVLNVQHIPHYPSSHRIVPPPQLISVSQNTLSLPVLPGTFSVEIGCSTCRSISFGELKGEGKPSQSFIRSSVVWSTNSEVLTTVCSKTEQVDGGFWQKDDED